MADRETCISCRYLHKLKGLVNNEWKYGHVCTLFPETEFTSYYDAFVMVIHEPTVRCECYIERGDEMTGREYCLSQAGKCVLTDRDNSYGGKPENNFGVVAELWNIYIKNVHREDGLSSHDVAMMMALLKIARITTGTFKADSYIDLAGYAACAMECASTEEGVTKYE